MLDVVAPAEQQRYEDGGAAREPGERLRQQRFVQLDVAEAHVEAGPRLPYPFEESRHGPERSRVPAAVRHGDQGRGACKVAEGVRDGAG